MFFPTMINFMQEIIKNGYVRHFCYSIWALFAWSYFLFYMYEKKWGHIDQRTKVIKKKVAPYFLTAAIIGIALYDFNVFISSHTVYGEYGFSGLADSNLRFYPSEGFIFLFNIFGMIFMLLGLFLVITGRFSLNGFWGPHLYDYPPEAKSRLITEGAYKNIRHPIYAGQLLMYFGTCLIYNNILFYILFACILLALISRISLEEGHNIDKFGNNFIQYKEKTSFLIRFII